MLADEAQALSSPQNDAQEADTREDAQAQSPTDGATIDAPQPEPYRKPEEIDWKKRYDGMKRHHDAKLDEMKRELETYRLQLDEATKPKFNPPSTQEDLDKFRQEYPDIYNLVETLADERARQTSTPLEKKVASLEEEKKKIVLHAEHQELLRRHPDWEKLKTDPSFRSWFLEQPQTIQAWITDDKNPSAALASRAIDLYKNETGRKTEEKKPIVRPNAAAEAVKLRGDTTIKTTTEPTFTQSQIRNMSLADFEKRRDVILKAQREGRILRG